MHLHSVRTLFDHLDFQIAPPTLASDQIQYQAIIGAPFQLCQFIPLIFWFLESLIAEI